MRLFSLHSCLYGQVCVQPIYMSLLERENVLEVELSQGLSELPLSVFESRRKSFFEYMKKSHPDSIAVLFSAPEKIRNHDVEYEYRQDSDFYYLTGLNEPQSVAVLDAASESFYLFLRPKDPDREIWDGVRLGVEGAKSLGANRAWSNSEVQNELASLLEGKEQLFVKLGLVKVHDEIIFQALQAAKKKVRLGVTCPKNLVDLSYIMSEFRLRKEDSELRLMKKACGITSLAHCMAMATARPGVHEYELEATLLHTFRKYGAERVAYPCIVGAGDNATILHYRAGSKKAHDGDLVLIDAGCEYAYYASDVTRVFPVNGSFSPEQKAIYEVVLEAQLEAIKRCVVGSDMDLVHSTAVSVIVSGLLRLGLLRGNPDDLIREEKYKSFYMHRTGHWLGMDVHDVGNYFVDKKPRKFEQGMVLTVEPGIYISKKNEEVDPKWRGIGVRIEDDILVEGMGPINLTDSVPKTVAEVESACRG